MDMGDAANTSDTLGEAYPHAEWRLLLEQEPRAGAWNMALDEAIMDAVAEGAAPPTLRLYQWAPPCLSLGRRQPLAGVDLAQLRADGCESVRRATGGWSILHTDELTYSVALTPDDPRANGPILDAYRKLSAGLVAGLALLGVDASPMEGFVPAEFDRVLSLPAQGLTAVVCCALGYRAAGDKYATAPKVRFPLNELVKHL